MSKEIGAFKEYQSKPIKRLAHKVTAGDVITKVEGQEATFNLISGKSDVDFKAYEEVNIGDYIVFLNDNDIYHCNAEVFAERNIINE